MESTQRFDFLLQIVGLSLGMIAGPLTGPELFKGDMRVASNMHRASNPNIISTSDEDRIRELVIPETNKFAKRNEEMQ